MSHGILERRSTQKVVYRWSWGESLGMQVPQRAAHGGPGTLIRNALYLDYDRHCSAAMLACH